MATLDKTLLIRVTADEAQALALLAEQDGRSLSGYVRQLIRSDLALQTAETRYTEETKA